MRAFNEEVGHEIPEEDDADVEQESSVESEATTVVEEVEKPHQSNRDETNLMGPVQPTAELVKKVFQPAGYYQAADFELMHLEAEEDPEAFGKMQLRMQTADVHTT